MQPKGHRHEGSPLSYKVGTRAGHSGVGLSGGCQDRPLLPVQHERVELKEVGRLQDGALGGKERAGGPGKTCGMTAGGEEGRCVPHRAR